MSQRKLTSPEFETCRARLRSREFKQRRGPGGRRLCFWCEAEVTEPKRQTWCSKDCVNNYLLFFGPALRRIITQRDGFECRLCGLDTKKLEHRIGNARWNDVELRTIKSELSPMMVKKIEARKGKKTFYNIDHIVPLSEGGKHELDNLRVLCLACHQEETNKLAARRAAKRKAV